MNATNLLIMLIKSSFIHIFITHFPFQYTGSNYTYQIIHANILYISTFHITATSLLIIFISTGSSSFSISISSVHISHTYIHIFISFFSLDPVHYTGVNFLFNLLFFLYYNFQFTYISYIHTYIISFFSVDHVHYTDFGFHCTYISYIHTFLVHYTCSRYTIP